MRGSFPPPGRTLRRTLAAVAALALSAFAPGNPEERAGARDGDFGTGAGGGRRPQAIAVASFPGGGDAVVVGHRTGAVSVIRASDRTLLGETPVGGDITSLAVLPGAAGDPPRLLAVDHRGGRLLVLRVEDDVRPGPPGGDLFPAARSRPVLAVDAAFPTCRNPRRAVIEEQALAVSCLWPREVRGYELGIGAGVTLEPAWTGRLPFEAGELLFLDPEHLLVADAFGGGLALLDAATGALERSFELPSHNLRGLALTPDREQVAIVHQQLHSGMHTSSDDIRWGVFLTNSVRLFPVDDLIAGDPRMHRRARVLDLGTVSSPSGDPAAILAAGDGQLVVALSGVGRLAFGAPAARQVSQVRVGAGPSALALSGDELFVANTWSDSVSVVSLTDRTETARMPLGPPAALTAADRGELLFHDATLSLRGWMSCNSCHTNGHTNHRLSDTLGDGAYGAPKRVLSLLGVRDTGPWAWNGKIRKLEHQVVKSVETTLRGRDLAPREVDDLTAYLLTLELPEMGEASTDAALVARGRDAFSAYTCNRCHTEPLYTSPGAHDVGLTDERGNAHFNPPSLRGVRTRRRLLHDGSAHSLEEVLRVHPGHGIVVSEGDLPALIAFLRTL